MAKTILLVDDDNLMRKGMNTGLSGAGYQVVEATNGKEGLDKALEVHPDLIIADVLMPEMSGLEMLEHLRKDDWGKQAPVIIMSSDDGTSSVNQALQAGVTVYLAKAQLMPDVLVDQVRSTIGE